MGSDLQLTGLASGFDWKPVVEQLVELEAIPKRRLQSEKSANEEKISDLGLLKSQLDSLNGAASALNNDDLYEARKVGMDSTSAAILSASAAAGALTGDYVVSIYSIGTETEMSSKNRVPGGLGAGLNLATKLNELPLQTAITTGTYTIAGKTLSIDNLDVTLQSIINEINAAVGGVSGVNPESDTTGITFEYDAANDRMIVDGGELSPNSLNAVPVMGSPTDTSNFLEVLRLLNRANVTRDADLEVGSGISVYGTGNSSGTSAWLRLDDGDIAGLNSTDSRMFASDGSIIYKRVAHDELLYNATQHYTTGQKVYRQGFVYEMKAGKNLPNNSGSGNGSNWDKTITGVGQDAWYGSQHWKLLIDLTTSRIGAGTGNVDFTAAVDAGHHGVNLTTNATTANGNAIKAGDIVKAADGEYYRAIRDRTSSTAVAWNNYATDHSTGLAAVAAGNPDWNNNIPVSIYNNGRMFTIKAGFNATEHAGAADSTLYNTANGWGAATNLVVGNRGVNIAKVNYYTPKTAAWNNVGTHTGIADVASYTNGKVVLSGSDFFEAQMDFSSINVVANNVKYSTGDHVKNAGGTNYYEAGTNWAAVQSKSTAADPFGTTFSQYVQIGGASGDFFKPKQDFDNTNFPTYDNTTYYQGTGILEVKDGSGNYYIRTANSKVADVNNGASTTITGAQLTTAIGSSTTFFVNSGTIYTPNATLTGITAHNAGSAYDTTGGAVYVSGGTNQIYQASSNFKGSFANTNALAQNQILKDGGGNWYRINDLSTYTAWDGTNNPYNQNDIVQDQTDSSRYYKKTSAGTLNANAANQAPSIDTTNWTLATASDLGTDVNANATTLGSALWTDVTSTFTDLTDTTGWSSSTASLADAGWTSINNAVKDPAVGGLTYWTNETSTLGDPTTGGNWWTDRTTVIGTPSNDGTYWSNKTSDINNLAVVDGVGGEFAETYWEKKDLSAPSVDGGNTYWEEKGFINATNSATIGNHDTNYWQRILPNMKRYDGTSAQLNSIDYSIWAKAGNINSVSGDNTYANHDGSEHPTGSTFNFTAWNAGTAYTVGEYAERSGKVYRALSTAGTNNDPALLSNADKWTLIADSVAEARKHVYVDTDYWDQFDIGSNLSTSNYWEKMQETVIQSSQALGTINMQVSLASANFGTALTSNPAGLGNFFIGEGEGAVRIDYNVNSDTVATLVDRVNSSDSNVHMYYDPVSDRFVVRNKEAGSIGITLHESTSWDALTANQGTGNLLNAMGLAAISANYTAHNTANNSSYLNGTYVSLAGIGGDPTTFWQALQDAPTEDPSTSSTQWRQVIPSVGRAMVSELGQNSTVRVNEGDLVYSNKTVFTDAEHGYDGITFDIAQAAVNDSASFVVARDSSQAKAAIDKLVEEFNDAQDYIKSLTSVTNDGERVSAGKFSSNIEISRLGSQLRKVVFGDSTPHSQSGTTSDGSNLVINERDAGSSELIAIATDLNFDSNNDGYIVKVLDDNNSGSPKYWKYEAAGGGSADWTETDPVYTSFRLSNIGLDFGIGSDRIIVKNSALLLQELETNPEKVKALFSDARVESTKTATASDLNLTPTPQTLNNNDPNNPTGANANVGDTIANSAAYDANTSTYRSYQGISNALDEFISAFLSGDENTGYRGAYNTHIESIRSQNKRIDERIEDMERYLEQREKTLSDGFMRMEEMQSQLNTQLQTLQNSFNKK